MNLGGIIAGAFLAAGVATGVGLLVAPAMIAGAGGAASFFGTAFLTSTVLTGITSLMAKKPQDPGALSFSAQGRTVTIRQAISPWEVVLGRTRKGGVLTFRYVSSDRKFWHMVITLACHRCEAIEQIWFDDELVALDAQGRAFGKWAKAETTRLNTRGTIPGSPYQVTVSGLGSFEEAAIVGVVNSMTDVSPNAPAARHEVSRSGTTFTFHSSAAGLQYSINYFAASTTESYVRVQKSLGDESTSTQPFPDLVTESGGAWTQDHKQYGHTKIYVRLEANPEIFPNGVPNVTAVVKGARLYDPRTAATAYAENAALAVVHVLTNSEYGFGADYTEEIHEDDLTSAADSCDENVTRAAGGTEKRYVVGGTFNMAQTPREVLGRLMGACAGTLVNLGDQWHINVGVYHAPTVTLTDTHVAGETIVNPFLPAQETCNGVKGLYVEPSKNWQATDFPAVQSASALSEDGGDEQWKDVDYSMFVTSSGQAQRLAKIDLLRSRQSLSEDGLFKLEAWKVVPGRSVARTDTDMGWTAKAFEVLESQFEVNPSAAGPVLGIRPQLRETAAAVYDFATNEDAVGDLAPNTALPDAGTVPAPGAPVIVPELYETTGSAGVKVRATVTWAPSVYPFGASYQLEYKLSSASVWTLLPLVMTASGNTGMVQQVVTDLESETYDWRVKAIGLSGAQSSYASTLGNVIVGLRAPPAAVTEFNITPRGNGFADLSWARHADLDVRIGGRILIRYTPITSGATWNDGVQIADAPGDARSVSVPHLSGTYLAKARDSSGNESTSTVSVITTEPALLNFNAVATVTGETTWPGTRVDVVERSGALQLACNTEIDSMTDPIDSWPLIDSWGGVAAEGTLAMADIIDLGAVYTSRLTARIDTLSFGTGDPIDNWLEPIDNWGLIDGPEISATSAEILIATTPDDPNASPTWSAWNPFVIGDYKARGFKFMVRLRSSNLEENIRVESLVITVDMPDREELQTDIASGLGTKTVTWAISPAFKVAPHLGITAKNMATGDFFTVTNESVTSFDIRFKNSAGADVNRTFNARGKAY